MVDVLNFGSGSGDINVMSSLKLWDPRSGKTATTVSKTYVGEFSQSAFLYVPWSWAKTMGNSGRIVG